MAWGAAESEKLLARQYGLVSRPQAAEMGLTASGIRHRIRAGGPWQRLLPGVYLTIPGQPSWDQKQMAALLYAGPGSALTGYAALASVQPPREDRPDLGRDTVDVLVPSSRQRAGRAFVIIHRTWRMPQLVAEVGALRYVLPARAVVDAVNGETRLSDVRSTVFGAVQAQLCRVSQLVEELEHGQKSGSALLRSVLAEARDGIRSAPEAELRDLIVAARLPMPLFNHSLYQSKKFLAIPDAYWPQHGVIVEIDSWEWHGNRSRQDWDVTLRRHNRLEAIGLKVLHVSPSQLRAEADVVRAEITEALGHSRPVPGIVARPPAGV
jgi:very-short-patch-repair endonuclease